MKKKHFGTVVEIDFGRIERAHMDAARQAMREVGEDWNRRAMKALSQHTTPAAGLLSKLDVSYHNSGLTVRLAANAPHAAVLHEGRGKNKKFPPVDAIRKWIRRSLGYSRAEAEELSYLVGRKIAKQGFFTTKKAAGSKYAEKGEGGTYGTRFATGPLEERGGADGKWQRFVEKRLEAVK